MIRLSLLGVLLALGPTALADSIMVGRDAHIRGGRNLGRVQAMRDVSLEQVEAVSVVQAGRHVQLHNTTVNGPVQAGGRLTLTRSTVAGHTMAVGPVTVESSRIQGNLHTASPTLTIRDSAITGNVRIGPQTTSHGGGGGVVITGNAQGTTIVSHHSTVIHNGRILQAGDWPPASGSAGGNGPSVLVLDGASVIEGDVIFEGGSGQVRLGPNARIQGRILGGQTVNF
jgi:hypothetical protein